MDAQKAIQAGSRMLGGLLLFQTKDLLGDLACIEYSFCKHITASGGGIRSCRLAIETMGDGKDRPGVTYIGVILSRMQGFI